MKKIVHLLIIAISISCNSKTTESSTNYVSSNEPNINTDGETYKIELDSITPLFNFHSQPIFIDNEEMMLWFNQENSSLDFYELRNGKLETRLKFELNGPNSIPGMGLGAGIKYINQDSIIIYSGQLKRIYLANQSGTIYNKIDLSNYANGFGSIGLSSPMAYRKGYLFMQIMPNISIDASDFYSPDYNRIAKIDLKTGEFEEFYIDIPNISKGVEISQQLKMIDIIYNPKVDKFIINLPLSDKIIVTDFKNFTKEYEAKSSLVNEVIKYGQVKTDVPQSNLVNYFYWINSSYEKIIYDPINDLYYREARKGISEEKYKQRDFSEQREIIVLNSEFDKIATFSSENTDIFYYFFLKDYFYWNKDIQKFNLESGVEDYIFFQKKQLDFN